jgi:hypothetical protein
MVPSSSLKISGFDTLEAFELVSASLAVATLSRPEQTSSSVQILGDMNQYNEPSNPLSNTYTFALAVEGNPSLQPLKEDIVWAMHVIGETFPKRHYVYMKLPTVLIILFIRFTAVATVSSCYPIGIGRALFEEGYVNDNLALLVIVLISAVAALRRRLK